MGIELPPTLRVLERGWLSSNNIVFLDDEEGASVVDTGYVTHAHETLALVRQALAGRALRRIVNTHLHSDHAGGNALLQAHFDCQCWIPPGLADAVERWDEAQLSYAATGQQCPRFRHDALLSPGQVLTLGALPWQVLPAAGHDPDMVMLWCAPEGVLISADALWRHGFGIIFPELVGDDGFGPQRHTLELIKDLAPRVVIPGHGAPFAGPDVGDALAAAGSRLQWLAEHPRRHAEIALKALLAFKLLEAGRLTRDQLRELIARSALLQGAGHVDGQSDPEALAVRAAEQLGRGGAARWDGLVLEAVGPPSP